MHLKRNSMPKTWPLQKKGTTYITGARDGFGQTIPLIIVLRDILKLAKTRKEVKAILTSRNLKLNEKVIKDEKYPVRLFDTLIVGEKSFKTVLKNKKFSFEPGKSEKIAKIIGKKILAGKVQLNLNDGSNIITKEKTNVGDSIIISKDKKIEILAFKEKCNILFIKGKHLGEQGTVEKIQGEDLIIKLKDEKINARQENVIVIK
ncbi:MAG: S4 domain-containing protein [Candidatus Pacearchaeota archaeon]|nr:S4 domain-containing protein [Candidatus Pacearchaeota archaeon]